MNTTRLRPLSVGDLFDGAFRLYRAHFRTLLAITLLIYVPSLLLLFVTSFLQPDVGDVGPSISGARWSVLLGSLLNGALVQVSASAYLGQPINLLDAYRSGVRRWLTLILAAIIPQLIYSLIWPFRSLIYNRMYFPLFLIGEPLPRAQILPHGLPDWLLLLAVVVLVLLPRALLYGFVALAPQAVMLEGYGPLGALGRSWRLVRGAIGRMFVVVVTTSIIRFLIFYSLRILEVLTLYHSNFVLELLKYLGLLLLPILIQPLLAAIFTLLYYDLRVRKEGYDLELRMQQAALP
jgi:hypothetical protein